MSFLGHSYFPGKHSFEDFPTNKIFNKKFKFEEEESPKVTFFVLCGESLAGLVGLLESIQENSVGFKIELKLLVVVGEVGVLNFIENNLQGVSISHLTKSDSILTSLNTAISAAKGEYFTVLHTSILIQKNWLNELVKGISEDQNVGIIGGKVIAVDGLLDEAGTFVASDFLLKKYGEYDFPERPKYNFVREVEFATGSNFIIRKVDFVRVGGFDDNLSSFVQAFCALSLSFRTILNRKILYSPLAKVIRSEVEEKREIANLSPIVELKDDNSSFRRVDMDFNARTLLHPRTILFIDIGLPEPDRDSGSLRAFYLLKILRQLGNHVIVVPRKGQVSSPYFEDLIRLGIEIIYSFPDQKGMNRELKVLLPTVAIAWICRPQLNKEFEWIFDINPKIKWVFDTIDLHYVRLEREAAIVNSKKLMRKSARFKKLELSIAQKADMTLTVTEDEKKLLIEQGVKSVSVIPNVHEVHLLNHYPPFSEREGLLFIGSYHHPPNVDAVRWLIEGIMPIVWEKLRIPVTLLGNAPSKEVMELESELVKVPGYVKDVTPYFTSHRVFVAPLRYGAGMKGKIGQSLSFKLPIITTAIGAEGVGLTDNLDVLIAEDKRSFAERIIRAYQNEQLWNQLSDNSEKVLKSYSPEQIEEDLRALIEGL